LVDVVGGLKVPVGVFMTPEESRRFDEFQKNHIWISKNYENLLMKYPNSWVAVKDRRVVETGMHYESFLSSLKRKYEFGPTELAIGYMDARNIRPATLVSASIVRCPQQEADSGV